ncbi:MAG: transcriptional regulator [Bacillales bacterium]|jgi:two-component system response regulator ResD|nr:transcriptional regulator [Bacillales bacterium]
MSNYRVLLVDDEMQMRNLIGFYLTQQNFDVVEATDGIEAMKVFTTSNFDLVILDVMMPNMNGWEVCRNIREISNVPIIMLTARTDLSDKVHGFQQGADDYLTKPFEIEELLVRVNALLRRSKKEDNDKDKDKNISVNGMIINPISRKLYINNEEINVTRKEFDLLFLLASNRNRVYDREFLLQNIWGDEFFGDDRTVDQHVKNIREKFRKNGASFNPIETVWGLGYKFKE